MFWGWWRDSPERFAKRIEALRERSWEAQFQVSISEAYVELADPHGTKNRISWKDLRSVRIETTGMGPWVNDYSLVMESASQTISIPLGAKNFDRLMKRLSVLPRWNGQAAVESLGSTEDADFVCWKRDEASDVQLR